MRVIDAAMRDMKDSDMSQSENASNASSDDVSNDNNCIELFLDEAVKAALDSVTNRRYLFPRKPYRKGRSKLIFKRDLEEEDDNDGRPPWLTNDEFKQKYRMDRHYFFQLVDKIKDHPVFVSRGRKKQAPVEHQLMVFLFFIGTSGSGASNPVLRNMFCIGRGTADRFKKRVVKAIHSLRNEVIIWPNGNERKAIARRFFTKYQWINCIAVADGTLFPLTYEPETEDAADYKGRKFLYSITSLIVNDDKKKIRFCMTGYPGSVHDNRVMRNTDLFKNAEIYFGNNYYLIGDSAYVNTSFIVSSFKCHRGHQLSPQKERFNTHMGKARIISEHTIGILKGRFPILRSIPMVVKKEKKAMKRILRTIECCFILHNLLIDAGDDDVPPEWADSDDDASHIAEAVGEYDFAAPIIDEDQQDERRQRCMEYFSGLGGDI